MPRTRFVFRSLSESPIIQQIQQDVQEVSQNSSGVPLLLVSANRTLQQGQPLVLYCDLSQSFQLQLPTAPISPTEANPEVKDFYEIVTLEGGGGVLTVLLGANPINGGLRESIMVPPGRSLTILYLGGTVGWVTDRAYTNRAIGKPVLSLLSRPPDNWPDDGIVLPDNLDRATDGNLGTETGLGRTRTSLSNLGLYLDFATPQTFSQIRVTGRLVESFGRNESVPVTLILWTSFDLVTFDDLTVGDFEVGANETVPFSVDRSGLLQGRYAGLAIYYTGRFAIDFVLQEIEIS